MLFGSRLDYEGQCGVERMSAVLIPDIHSQLEGHVAIGFTLRCHRWESGPHLLAGSIDASKLNSVLVAGEGTVVNVEEIARHGWQPLVGYPEQPLAIENGCLTWVSDAEISKQGTADGSTTG